MDNEKIGQLIYQLRKEKGMTQKQLADAMLLSDRTISKWERGSGCPDISLLPQLSTLLEVPIEDLLVGEVTMNEVVGGNMKNHFIMFVQIVRILDLQQEISPYLAADVSWNH